MRKTIIMLLAVLVVCAGAFYAWHMLFSSSAGGTSVVGGPVVLSPDGDGSGTGAGTDGISDEVARSTFKSFVLAMAEDDGDTACGFSAYEGAPVGPDNHWDDCRDEVEETVGGLSDPALATLRDALRTAAYAVTSRPGSGGATVSTTVLGETLSGTVVDAAGEARVELSSLVRR
ncbi:hypothetical protein [Actinomyces sp.]|uniref:hypothetical protein n=1 Tax=Actinomyces sp. TaxID=29317 RepID=UPI0028A1564C|nr:hypothetical protein [Actinomyces sp.]